MFVRWIKCGAWSLLGRRTGMVPRATIDHSPSAVGETRIFHAPSPSKKPEILYLVMEHANYSQKRGRELYWCPAGSIRLAALAHGRPAHGKEEGRVTVLLQPQKTGDSSIATGQPSLGDLPLIQAYATLLRPPVSCGRSLF